MKHDLINGLTLEVGNQMKRLMCLLCCSRTVRTNPVSQERWINPCGPNNIVLGIPNNWFTFVCNIQNYIDKIRLDLNESRRDTETLHQEYMKRQISSRLLEYWRSRGEFPYFEYEDELNDLQYENISDTLLDMYTNLSKVAIYIESIRLSEDRNEHHSSLSSYLELVERRHYYLLCTLRGLIRCLGGEVHSYISRVNVDFPDTDETELRWSRDIIVFWDMITNYSNLNRFFRSVRANQHDQRI